MNTNNTHKEIEHPDAAKPWYKQVWPWILIGLPGSAVLACIVTVIIAVRSPISLVEDDYYKEGLAVNINMEKQRNAEAAGIKGSVAAQPSLGTFELSLDNVDLSAIAENPITMKLIHPAEEAQDRETQLLLNASGSLSGTVVPFDSGNWSIRLEPLDQQWRLVGSLRIHEQSPKIITITVNPG